MGWSVLQFVLLVPGQLLVLVRQICTHSCPDAHVSSDPETMAVVVAWTGPVSVQDRFPNSTHQFRNVLPIQTPPYSRVARSISVADRTVAKTCTHSADWFRTYKTVDGICKYFESWQKPNSILTIMHSMGWPPASERTSSDEGQLKRTAAHR